MSNALATFSNLYDVAVYLREKIEDKKYILLFAYNGTGKTRLSTKFKDIGKNEDSQDTLYFNAFTEDLFLWENDLDNDLQRELRINIRSKFFEGLADVEMETRTRKLLHCLANFNFKIDKRKITKEEIEVDQYPQSITYEEGEYYINFISFEREVVEDGKNKLKENIKISRGEENLFIWCFFLAIAQIVLDQEEGMPYDWVKYIYIDDPISSLDDNNTIAVANQLATLLKKSDGSVKTIISSHHALFYNVICNELKKGIRYMLCNHEGKVRYSLKDTSDTPYFHHVATLKLLTKAAMKNELYTYHFSMLRNIMERSASFHGFNNLSDFLKHGEDEDESTLHHRVVQVLNHAGYSHFEPIEMVEDNKDLFKEILGKFLGKYEFNPELLPITDENMRNDLENSGTL